MLMNVVQGKLIVGDFWFRLGANGLLSFGRREKGGVDRHVTVPLAPDPRRRDGLLVPHLTTTRKGTRKRDYHELARVGVDDALNVIGQVEERMINAFRSQLLYMPLERLCDEDWYLILPTKEEVDDLISKVVHRKKKNVYSVDIEEEEFLAAILGLLDRVAVKFCPEHAEVLRHTIAPVMLFDSEGEADAGLVHFSERPMGIGEQPGIYLAPLNKNSLAVGFEFLLRQWGDEIFSTMEMMMEHVGGGDPEHFHAIRELAKNEDYSFLYDGR